MRDRPRKENRPAPRAGLFVSCRYVLCRCAAGLSAGFGDVQPAAGFGTFGHCRGENEFVELPVVGIQDVVLVAFPPLLPFVDEDHVFADLEHRVHVVRVDDRGMLVLLGISLISCQSITEVIGRGPNWARRRRGIWGSSRSRVRWLRA